MNVNNLHDSKYQGVVIKMSHYSFNETIERLKSVFNKKGIKIFISIDQKHTKNLVYRSLMNTTPKTEEQIANAAISLAVKKVFYEFDSDEDPEAVLSNLDIKEQKHISDVVNEVVTDLTDKGFLKVNPDTSVSLTTDGISYILSIVPKNYF